MTKGLKNNAANNDLYTVPFIGDKFVNNAAHVKDSHISTGCAGIMDDDGMVVALDAKINHVNL